MIRNKITFALLTVGVAAALAAACVPDQSDDPVRILGAVEPPTTFDPNAECPFGSGVKLLSGSLDVANPAFVMDFQVESNLAPTTAAGTLSDPNDFILEEIAYTYKTTPNKNVKAETRKAYDVIRAGSTSTFRLNLISPAAGTTLSEGIGADELVDLEVTFQLKGRTGAGGGAESNLATYPIRLFNSGFTGACQVRANGPCGASGGQNGAPLQCCPSTASLDGGTAPAGCAT